MELLLKFAEWRWSSLVLVALLLVPALAVVGVVAGAECLLEQVNAAGGLD